MLHVGNFRKKPCCNFHSTVFGHHPRDGHAKFELKRKGASLELGRRLKKAKDF